MRTKILCMILVLFIYAVVLALTPITLQKGGINLIYMQEWLETFQPVSEDDAVISANVDGDTVKVLLRGQQETVRLIGVDTPETVHPSKPVEYFGKAASKFTSLMLQPNEQVKLTYDWNPRDKYNRLLAYVWFEAEYNGRKYWILHNLALIINGFGHPYTSFPFNEEYEQTFISAERYAFRNYIGLWAEMSETKALELLEKGRIIKGQEEQEEEETTTYQPAPQQASVQIAKIQAGGRDEYIEIKNTGNVAVNLSDWKIWSKGGQWYTFSNITLQPGESVSIHSGPQATGIVWMKGYVWNNDGDEAVLYDAEGNVIDTYKY